MSTEGATLTAILGGIGLALSIYMNGIFVRVMRGEEVRCIDDVCPIVMKTGYAQSFGFPNSWLALPYYSLLILFALLQLGGYAPWLFVPMAVVSFIALGMSVYLAWALVVRLKQT